MSEDRVYSICDQSMSSIFPESDNMCEIAFAGEKGVNSKALSYDSSNESYPHEGMIHLYIEKTTLYSKAKIYLVKMC